MFITITLIDKSWNVLDSIRFRDIPRANELIYSKKNNCYYTVLNIIHKENWFRTEIFIVAELLNNVK